MVLPQFQASPSFQAYVNATGLDEVLEALTDGRGVPVAGGTDLWVQKSLPGAVPGDRLVNIRRVPELGGISVKDGCIRLGALVTMTEILESGALKEAAPLLHLAADRFASVQVRNAATIGGNVANASPAADMAPPLLCLDATVELASKNGTIIRRQVALDEFYTGPGQSVRKPGELITAIVLPVPASGHIGAFCKSGPRPALEISRVSMALAGVAKGGRLTAPRIAFGAVAPTPLRCPKTEAAIDGADLTDEAISVAVETMDGEISPIADHRASDWYRRHLARTYLEQELRHVRDG